MADILVPSVIDALWQRQSVWSQVARRLKREVKTSRTAVLALSIAGALFAALAVAVGAGSPPGRALAVAGALSLASVGVVRRRTGQDAVGDWTQTRSTSEALKSEAYLYLTRSGSYAGDSRDEELLRALDDIEQRVASMLRHAIGIEPLPRATPAVQDIASYIGDRVTRQIEQYYRPQAAEQQKLLRRARTGELWLAGIGAVLAAVSATFGVDSVAAWVPVVTTVSAAITAHAAAERYEYLLVEYLRTADELERLRRRYELVGGMSDEELVRACERVISLQNEGWMAKLTRDPASAE